MVTDEETMENLVVAIPELEHDPVAMTMLQELELLEMLADPKQIRKVIEAHPCLGQAALYIAAAINEEASIILISILLIHYSCLIIGVMGKCDEVS